MTEPWYVFNDLHAVMAFAGASRREDGHAVIDRLTQYIDRAHGTNAAMPTEICFRVACMIRIIFHRRHQRCRNAPQERNPHDVRRAEGKSTRAIAQASTAPVSCARINAGASMGRIPEKVLLKERAIVMAGFANDVDAVNQ